LLLNDIQKYAGYPDDSITGKVNIVLFFLLSKRQWGRLHERSRIHS